jgi:hypothetical protein
MENREWRIQNRQIPCFLVGRFSIPKSRSRFSILFVLSSLTPPS